MDGRTDDGYAGRRIVKFLLLSRIYRTISQEGERYQLSVWLLIEKVLIALKRNPRNNKLTTDMQTSLILAVQSTDFCLGQILQPKMPFFVRQKVQISSKSLPQIPNFASFSPPENEALSAVYNCYGC